MEYGGGPRSTEPPRSTRTSVGALAPTSTSTLRSASPRAATSCGVTRGRAAQCDEGGQHCTRPAVTLVTCDTRITPNTRLSLVSFGSACGATSCGITQGGFDEGDGGFSPAGPTTSVTGRRLHRPTRTCRVEASEIFAGTCPHEPVARSTVTCVLAWDVSSATSGPTDMSIVHQPSRNFVFPPHRTRGTCIFKSARNLPNPVPRRVV